MGMCRVRGSALLGVEAVVVEVEVDSRQGLPRVLTVGLPDATVRESEERVRAAIRNSGFPFPAARLTVSLAPADLRKVGSGLDLPVAVGILGAGGTVKRSTVPDLLLLGELSLDGRLRPVPGTLAAAVTARRHRLQGLVVPQENAAEAAAVRGVHVFPATHLLQVVAHLNGDTLLEVQPAQALVEDPVPVRDLSEVRGQRGARRALEVAAAGGHNLLLMGPPGSGKTLLARCLSGILPPLSEAAAVEVACIRSAAGEWQQGPLLRRRPFRAPHHSISAAGLVGGGSLPRPGEISLAHHGVLFLDEMLEFTRSSLEALRQPLEDGCVTVARARRTLTFPAAFALVGAMNPCPCGYRGDPRRECMCTPAQIERYRSRLSGPLLDRIDLHVEVPPVGYHELLQAPDGEASAVVRLRVEAARATQRQRFALPSEEPAAELGVSDPCNARMSTQQIERWVALDARGSALLERAVMRLGLSARSHHRILRVARTLADLSQDAQVQPCHLAEAIHYRTLDRPIT